MKSVSPRRSKKRSPGAQGPNCESVDRGISKELQPPFFTPPFRPALRSL
jgi:hypothetical protein